MSGSILEKKSDKEEGIICRGIIAGIVKSMKAIMDTFL